MLSLGLLGLLLTLMMLMMNNDQWILAKPSTTSGEISSNPIEDMTTNNEILYNDQMENDGDDLLETDDDDSNLNTEMALKFMSMTKNTLHELDTNGGKQFQDTIPIRVFECLKRYPLIRCVKHFALQKMEEHPVRSPSKNLTKDFLDQFFDPSERIGSLVSEQYRRMSERELNKRLRTNFKKFFQNRDIQFQLLPSFTIRVVSSPENKFQFSLKKKTIVHNDNTTQVESSRHVGQDHVQGKELVDLLRDSAMDVSNSASYMDSDMEESLEDDPQLEEGTFKKGSGGGGGGGGGAGGAAGGAGGAGGGGGGKLKKNRNRMSLIKAAVLRMAVPAMFMPFIMLGTFLPFLLPVFKIATLVSILLNNAAFIAALIYAARAQMNSQDEHQVNYNYNGFSGYHH